MMMSLPRKFKSFWIFPIAIVLTATTLVLRRFSNEIDVDSNPISMKLITPEVNPESDNNPIIFKHTTHLAVVDDLNAGTLRKSIDEDASIEKIADKNTDTVIVNGRITTENGAQFGNHKIEIYSFSLNKGYISISNSDGLFQFNEVVAATDYQLRVVPDGMFKRFREMHVSILPPLSQISIQLKEIPVEALHGFVVNVEGASVAGFKLVVRSEEKGNWRREIITSNIGRFQLEGVPVGKLFFTSMLGQVLSIHGYQLRGHSSSTVRLVVDEGPHEVAGQIFDQFYEPVVGANVILSWNNTSSSARSVVTRHTITNLYGYFSLSGIGSGEHDLVIADSSGAANRRTIIVTDEVNDLSIQLSDALMKPR